MHETNCKLSKVEGCVDNFSLVNVKFNETSLQKLSN
jgi:hypothetical protein